MVIENLMSNHLPNLFNPGSTFKKAQRKDIKGTSYGLFDLSESLYQIIIKELESRTGLAETLTSKQTVWLLLKNLFSLTGNDQFHLA